MKLHRARPSLSLLVWLSAIALIAGCGGGSGSGSGGTSAPTTTNTALPCDTYAAAGTPCVAAHSTTRALFAAYSGNLYQVQRASDKTTTDIALLATGGYANAAAQDRFCASTTCIITIIYDQSSQHNHLTIEGPGGVGGQDAGVPADALPITAGGHIVYGASFSGVMGYRNNATSGIAAGGSPEGTYMVTSGTHYNDKCCFDYGNTEVTNFDTGNGHMDAVYFGSACWFAPCFGSGPWVQADLENGLFQSDLGYSTNTSYTGISFPYVTALMKNNGQNFFAIKDGNAQSGSLTTRYAGALPTNRGGYAPMHKEGGIVLGTGGDNSNGSIGSFFEGVMTAGMPSDAADDAVQANITSVGYGGPSPVASGTLSNGSTISLRATTASIRHQDINAVTSVITSSSSDADKGDGTWIVRAGLAEPTCVSFESRNSPGDFLRHTNFVLFKRPMDGSAAFRADATFCPETGKSGTGTTSFHSYNFPTRYIRNSGGVVRIDPNDATASWATDVSWVVGSPWTE